MAYRQEVFNRMLVKLDERGGAAVPANFVIHAPIFVIEDPDDEEDFAGLRALSFWSEKPNGKIAAHGTVGPAGTTPLSIVCETDEKSAIEVLLRFETPLDGVRVDNKDFTPAEGRLISAIGLVAVEENRRLPGANLLHFFDEPESGHGLLEVVDIPGIPERSRSIMAINTGAFSSHKI